MGKRKVNFLEGEYLDKGAGKKRRRGFNRKSADQKYAQVRDMDGEEENKPNVINFEPKKPIDAGNIHAGPSIQKSDRGKDFFSGEQGVQDEYPGKEKKPIYRTGPTWETAKRKPSHEISNEERIAAFEDEIASDFREDERRYVRKWVDIYPAEFRKAIEKREKNGGKVTEKELLAIRLSFINNIARWGTERGMVLEKTNLLEKYLELKLPPVSLEKDKDINASIVVNGEIKEKHFTPKQAFELLQLMSVVSQQLKAWVEESSHWGSEFGDEEKRKRAIFDQKIKEEVLEIIKNDPIMKDIFSEDEFTKAAEHVIKYVEKFNFK